MSELDIPIDWSDPGLQAYLRERINHEVEFLDSTVAMFEEGSDFVQDVNNRLWKANAHCGLLKGQPRERWESYINCAINCSIIDKYDYYHREKRGGDRNVLQEDSQGNEIVANAAGKNSTVSRKIANRELVENALQKLPQHYGTVIRLKYYEGKDVSEIAKQMEKSAQAVYALLDRAEDMLREIIPEDLYFTGHRSL